MKKITLIILALIWVSSLIILIVALTNLFTNNPFKEYRFIIGIGFLAITGFIGKAYQQLFKVKNSNG